jgi:hypothetical protein
MCILLRAGAAAAVMACMQAGRLPLLPLLTMRLNLQLVQHPCFHTVRCFVVSCSTTIMDGLALIPDARKLAVLERQHAKQEKQAELPFLPPSLCQIPDVWLDNKDFQFTAHCEGNRTLTVLAMQVSLSCRSTRCARGPGVEYLQLLNSVTLYSSVNRQALNGRSVVSQHESPHPHISFIQAAPTHQTPTTYAQLDKLHDDHTHHVFALDVCVP